MGFVCGGGEEAIGKRRRRQRRTDIRTQRVNEAIKRSSNGAEDGLWGGEIGGGEVMVVVQQQDIVNPKWFMLHNCTLVGS